MISNNLVLSSQNLKIATNLNEKQSFTTNPYIYAIKHKFQAKVQQSHTNLFNFINDTI